jgi:hypothetical protein
MKNIKKIKQCNYINSQYPPKFEEFNQFQKKKDFFLFFFPLLFKERDFKGEIKPGTMANVCNSRYLGGEDQEDHGSRAVWAKS